MYTHPAAGWHIRPFERPDYHPSYRLFRDCLKDFPWRGPMGPYLRQLFNSLPSSKAWVAEEEQAGVIGFLTLRKESAYVDHLFVHRDWRFCGVAQLCAARFFFVPSRRGQHRALRDTGSTISLNWQKQQSYSICFTCV